MIKEVSNFVERLDDEYFIEGLSPTEGLYFYIKLDELGIEVEKKCYIVKTEKKQLKCFDEKLTEIDFPYHLLLREYYSAIINSDQNKGLDLGGSGGKKIQSANPYSVWFKKEQLEKGESVKNLNQRFSYYFNNAKKYLDTSRIAEIDNIQKFCETELLKLLVKQVSEVEKVAGARIKPTNYIKITFETDIDTVKKCYEEYLGSKLFNKSDYNLENNEYGLSGFKNSDNPKKILIMHKTTSFNINNHISRKEATNLYLFERLLKNKPNSKLPNPLPIFVDETELNSELVRLYSKEGVNKYHEIIKILINYHKRDLSNYYLLFWSKMEGWTLHDLDFVPQFRFKLEDFIMSNYFLKDSYEGRIENVFQFEYEIVQKIFSNVLIQKYEDKSSKEKKILFKYFDEIEYNSKFMTKTTHINVLKYRKSFYDFIYKSKSNAINSYMFSELMLTTIIDDIKHHNNKTGYNATDYNIKEKLNIYFSLNKNFGGEDMGSKIQPLQEKLKLLLKEPETHIETDEEFAFAAGQLVYYILYQSEASNKTHALMEPYITKNDPTLFKSTVARGIEQYKHKFLFGTKRFQKLASEVLAWETETKIKEMLPLFLAGYFSNSLLFDSSK
ncbi:MAG: hypothetical protein KF721_12375 [Ignavibacteriaceae bacterium]|nr:hypothetical protein [Ignavibacteriaceae bacterium]